ncbi:CDP-glycerol glycerophosphotransferase family protein [Thauera sp. SDU_THAU2]|uniref:CDP-glycerol glycerophosphotransferase family protein n=1 Tax=Thauera sp. SDU_THAU2 TaxID=3136633 RepID=UPI00311F0A09
MMITDYLSVAFEMAYLERPVLYYLLDIDQLFSTGHFYKRGYFEYLKDGFGPVETALDALLDQVEATCAGREKPDYVPCERTLLFRDGHWCARVHEAILRLEEPARPSRRTGAES